MPWRVAEAHWQGRKGVRSRFSSTAYATGSSRFYGNTYKRSTTSTVSLYPPLLAALLKCGCFRFTFNTTFFVLHSAVWLVLHILCVALPVSARTIRSCLGAALFSLPMSSNQTVDDKNAPPKIAARLSTARHDVRQTRSSCPGCDLSKCRFFCQSVWNRTGEYWRILQDAHGVTLTQRCSNVGFVWRETRLGQPFQSDVRGISLAIFNWFFD